MKTESFQSCGHCWVFQICWHIECSTLTASIFRIWNSSAVILLPSLALFIVMLHKAHLTSHSRISDSRWVITPLWLSGSWRSFLCSSSLYSCHLFLIFSASVRSIPFLSFIVSIFAWNIPLVSLIFLKRSLVFPILLFSSISLYWSLRKASLSLLALLWNTAFRWIYLSFLPLLLASPLFSTICKPSSEKNLPFYISFSFNLPSKSVRLQGFPDGSVGKESTCNAGDARNADPIPGSRRPPGRENGNPLQYSCQENPMERSLQIAIHGTAESGHDWVQGRISYPFL